jgi:hypothetical protein
MALAPETADGRFGDRQIHLELLLEFLNLLITHNRISYLPDPACGKRLMLENF